MSKRAAASSPVKVSDLLGTLNEQSRSEFGEQLAVAAVGLLVRQMRHNAGLTQQQLAELIGTPQVHVSNIERGQGPNGPTVSTLARIADACGEKLVITAASFAAGELQASAKQLGLPRAAVVEVEASGSSARSIPRGRKVTLFGHGLVNQVAAAARISGASAEAAVGAVVEYVQVQVEKGNTVRIPGAILKRNVRFGTGKVRAPTVDSGDVPRHSKRKLTPGKHPLRRET